MSMRQVCHHGRTHRHPPLAKVESAVKSQVKERAQNGEQPSAPRLSEEHCAYDQRRRGDAGERERGPEPGTHDKHFRFHDETAHEQRGGATLAGAFPLPLGRAAPRAWARRRSPPD
jgi:hypothetical protein